MNKLFEVTIGCDQFLRVNEVCTLAEIGEILVTQILEINGQSVKFLGIAIN